MSLKSCPSLLRAPSVEVSNVQSLLRADPEVIAEDIQDARESHRNTPLEHIHHRQAAQAREAKLLLVASILGTKICSYHG